MYVCKAGHLAIHKKYDGRKGKTGNPRVRYLFDLEICKVCSLREGCYRYYSFYYVSFCSIQYQQLLNYLFYLFH